MAEKIESQHITAVNDNHHADTNLEQGTSKFGEDARRVQSLGSVRLRNEHTGEIVLVPTPTKDPNDPLNWSRPFKYAITILVCFAIFLCNFLAAGPVIAIVEIAQTFFPPETNPDVGSSIAKTAYFFTTTALVQGVSNFFWMPFINKFGRRPAYVISFACYTVCSIWAGVAKSYGSELAARIVLGFMAGSGECLAPLTISDIWFLHERGSVMAIYTCFLSLGVACGLIVDGLITIHNPWRVMYYVATALIGFCTVVVFFCFPETFYPRDPDHLQHGSYAEDGTAEPGRQEPDVIPPKKTYLQSLALFSGIHTKESMLRMFLRPLGLIIIPPVLWAALVMSVTIGFLVAVTSNLAPAFQEYYGMTPWQCGLCNISAVIGSLLGIWVGGTFSDKVADYFTKRNGGIREPEMRLPAMAVSLVTGPLALVFYGVGVNNHIHWMLPTVGLGLLNFTIVQATNVSFVYCLDSYKPIGGEVVITQLGFKAMFGFLLSFYTNPWVAESGYSKAYGAMAGIMSAVLVLFIPMFFYGKRMRVFVHHWKLLQWVKWDEDRETGE